MTKLFDAKEKRDLLKQGFSAEEIRQLEVQRSPALWAEMYLNDPEHPRTPLKLRPYQHEMLNYQGKKKVYRCVAEDCKVLLSNGIWVAIKDIKPGDIVVSYDKYKLKDGKVLNTFNNGVREVFRVLLNNGSYIDVTSDHELFAKIKTDEKYLLLKSGFSNKPVYRSKTKTLWSTIDNGLKVGDGVCVIRGYNTFGNVSDNTLAKFLGYMLTDGYFGKSGQTPKFTSNTIEYINEVKELSKELFGYDCVIKKRQESNAFDCYITDGNKTTTNLCNKFCGDYNITEVKYNRNRLPSIINTLDEESMGLFLNRVFAGDGCVSTWSSKSRPNSGELKLTSQHRTFIEDIQVILLKKDVHSFIKYEQRPSPSNPDKLCDIYYLSICDGTSIKNFLDWTGNIYGKEKQSLKILEQVSNRKHLRKQRGCSKTTKWEKILSITSLGNKNVYDIEVDEYHNFICNGMVTHNCGRRIGKSITLAIEAFYLAFINEGMRILICTPYKAQTASLWKDGFVKLMKSNPLLEASISKSLQNPYTIEFKNGSRILGLTAGSSTGNKGASIRGQSSDVLILDEVDYMGEDAIKSIQAIASTNRNTRVIISSTPTGKREYFYNACMSKDLGFKEFHFPSSASPEWLSIEDCKKQGLPLHESQEYLFRNTVSEAEYEHEYNANFSEETLGVYKHKYIDRAIVTYDPSLEEVDSKGMRWFCGDQQVPGNLYSIGVDWNGTKVGTQIVITEYCVVPTTIRTVADDGETIITSTVVKKYRMFYRESVSLENMTQLESISRIIALNNRFRIDHIYVDNGYGSTNIEELRLYGVNNPESGIKDKLVAIDFGSKLTVFDPYTKQEIQKTMKPFSVNNSIICLERDELILPDTEDEKVRLVGQMREYRVISISPTGNPRYTEDNDHILDAFNLSLLAFTMQYSEFIRLKHTNDVAISKNPSMLLPGLASVEDRTGSITESPLASLVTSKRAPALGADKYHSDSRGSHMDYDEMFKNAKPTQSPYFNGAPSRSGWGKVSAPSRSMF